MTKRTRFILYAVIAFVICMILILGMAYNFGQDPFAPETMHIWALSLIAAAYASIRIAMIAEKVLRWSEGGDGEGPKLRGFGLGNKKGHDIDRRMAARRERVEAAKEKSDNTDS
jgi:hypothetical protein